MTADELDDLTLRFHTQRARLRRIACGLLGSAADADDALQEAWIRMARADMHAVENLDAWLTTVVIRISLNSLRSARSRPSASLDEAPELASSEDLGSDPEQAVVLTTSLVEATQSMVAALGPSECVALVLHDVLGVPFAEVAGQMGIRSDSARQLASRARRRLRRSPARAGGRQISTARSDAFLAALRRGDVALVIAALVQGDAPRPRSFDDRACLAS